LSTFPTDLPASDAPEKIMAGLVIASISFYSVIKMSGKFTMIGFVIIARL
jgi:hypothetical protein